VPTSQASLAPSSASMAAAFQATAAAHPDAVALRTPDDIVSITWRDYAARVQSIAAGLATLGVRRGDTVALMMTNRPEFHLVDAAAFHLGATPFSVYNTSSPEQIAFLFSSAAPRVVVCEGQFLGQVRGALSLDQQERVVCVDDAADGCATLAEVEVMGDKDFDFEGAWRAVGPDDVLTLIYTSGTTGDPKGVQITHANMLAEIEGTNVALRAGHGDRVLSFLPSAHIADRWAAHYLQAVCGTQVTCIADRQQLLPEMVTTRPTMFGGVPQMWQKLRAVVEMMIAAEPDDSVREQMQQALLIGRERVQILQAGGHVPAELEAACQEAEARVFAPIRVRLGLDQARVVQSGAAPIALEVVLFFHAIGIPVSDVWGMSELSCVAAMSPPGGVRIGSIGRAIPGVEISLAEDGELIVRGPIVMRGYLDRPDLTAEAIDQDGWLHTGDIGTIDHDGFIRIVDRKKELIINAHGKNMSPANIESAVKACGTIIGQVVAVGDNRPYNVALIVLDADSATLYAARRGVECDPALLAADPDVLALVQSAVDRANATLSRVEQIKRFALLPTFWEPGTDLVTHTMKLRRRPIAQQYADVIDQLYAAEPALVPVSSGSLS
jgi:long-chain acyl-CoA synthetase